MNINFNFALIGIRLNDMSIPGPNSSIPLTRPTVCAIPGLMASIWVYIFLFSSLFSLLSYVYLVCLLCLVDHLTLICCLAGLDYKC